MRADLLQMAADLAHREEPFVLAVVVRRQPASSAQAGDMALITAAGAFHGWLGGSCTQPTVMREAQRALADGQPRLVVALARPGAASAGRASTAFPMTCHSGGSVEIYLEPVLPAPRLVVFGVSPTARALAKLGQAMGYSVDVVDPRPSRDSFRAPTSVVTDLAGRRSSTPLPAGPCSPWWPPSASATRRRSATPLALEPAYLGVVASRKRFAHDARDPARARRDGRGARRASAARRASTSAPDTPEEIALSHPGGDRRAQRAAREAEPARGAGSAEASTRERRGDRPDLRHDA